MDYIFFLIFEHLFNLPHFVNYTNLYILFKGYTIYTASACSYLRERPSIWRAPGYTHYVLLDKEVSENDTITHFIFLVFVAVTFLSDVSLILCMKSVLETYYLHTFNWISRQQADDNYLQC